MTFRFLSLTFLFFLCFCTPKPNPDEVLGLYPEAYEKEFEKNFSKTFFINLLDHKVSLTRREKMESSVLSDPLFSLTHFPAVYGTKISYERESSILQEITLPLGRKLTYLGKERAFHKKGLSEGELGNFISHYLLWEKISQDFDDNHIYLITEDDVTPVANFKKRFISAFYHAPDDWELLYFYSNQAYGWGCPPRKFDLVKSKRFVTLNKKCIPGTVTYALKPPTARKLMENALPFSEATDERINSEFIVPGTMKIYATFPELVKTPVYKASIIDQMGR